MSNKRHTLYLPGDNGNDPQTSKEGQVTTEKFTNNARCLNDDMIDV